MKKLDSRTKREQLFILLLMYVIFMSGVCIAGCGGQSCESPKYGSEEGDGFKAAGCSIPGFGGCLSFEKGCNSACWPQSCKISNGTYSGEGTNDKGCVTSLDIRYYGDGCFGCGIGELEYRKYGSKRHFLWFFGQNGTCGRML